MTTTTTQARTPDRAVRKQSVHRFRRVLAFRPTTKKSRSPSTSENLMPTAFEAPESKFCTPQNKVSVLPTKLNFPSLDDRDDDGDDIEEVPTVIADRLRTSCLMDVTTAPPRRAHRVVTPLPEETSDDESLGSIRTNLKLLFDEAES